MPSAIGTAVPNRLATVPVTAPSTAKGTEYARKITPVIAADSPRTSWSQNVSRMLSAPKPQLARKATVDRWAGTPPSV